MLHDWKFLSAPRGDGAMVVAVCGVCGVIRWRIVADERYIDLRGECPGKAQDPQEPPAPVWGAE